jgi:hypothetical protein
VSVEYLLSGSDCYAGQGLALPLQRQVASVFQSNTEWEKALYDNGARVPQAINGFDYTKSNLGVVYFGEIQSNVNYAVDRVALRGQSVTVYIKKSVSPFATATNAPYFLFKFDKKVRNIKVVEL